MRIKIIVKQILIITLTALVISAYGNENPPRTSTGNPSPQETALQLIIAYAEDGTNSKLVLQDYLTAGVVSVTAENLAALNAVVDTYALTDNDTVEKLEGLATQIKNNSLPVVNAETVQQVQINQSINLPANATDGTVVFYQWTNDSSVLAQT
ncbi:MAG: hypothetical protein ACI9WC_002178 [Arenicella sp.]|jgi:uncharacterized membrane protein